jgi:hypothetical protein
VAEECAADRRPVPGGPKRLGGRVGWSGVGGLGPTGRRPTIAMTSLVEEGSRPCPETVSSTRGHHRPDRGQPPHLSARWCRHQRRGVPGHRRARVQPRGSGAGRSHAHTRPRPPARPARRSRTRSAGGAGVAVDHAHTGGATTRRRALYWLTSVSWWPPVVVDPFARAVAGLQDPQPDPDDVGPLVADLAAAVQLRPQDLVAVPTHRRWPSPDPAGHGRGRPGRAARRRPGRSRRPRPGRADRPVGGVAGRP